MKGWKTWAAACGLFFLGAARFADALQPFRDGAFEGAVLMLAGLLAIGIGHKIEKGPR